MEPSRCLLAVPLPTIFHVASCQMGELPMLSMKSCIAKTCRRVRPSLTNRNRTRKAMPCLSRKMQFSLKAATGPWPSVPLVQRTSLVSRFRDQPRSPYLTMTLSFLPSSLSDSCASPRRTIRTQTGGASCSRCAIRPLLMEEMLFPDRRSMSCSRLSISRMAATRWSRCCSCMTRNAEPAAAPAPTASNMGVTAMAPTAPARDACAAKPLS
mmetsp:Transcript_72344/g.211961  ORF Transcript_72344/g.211961 Transcript_72344/m.211961 type:complete len:211 (+) Transcript_72344:457-1089(+)